MLSLNRSRGSAHVTPPQPRGKQNQTVGQPIMDCHHCQPPAATGQCVWWPEFERIPLSRAPKRFVLVNVGRGEWPRATPSLSPLRLPRSAGPNPGQSRAVGPLPGIRFLSGSSNLHIQPASALWPRSARTYRPAFHNLLVLPRRPIATSPPPSFSPPSACRLLLCSAPTPIANYITWRAELSSRVRPRVRRHHLSISLSGPCRVHRPPTHTGRPPR